MSPLEADVQFVRNRVAELLRGVDVKLTTDDSHNRIIVERPNATMKGVVVIEFRGARA